MRKLHTYKDTGILGLRFVELGNGIQTRKKGDNWNRKW